MRTVAGREEISQKACGLTQSERQVLIVVDGVTDYAGLVGKLARLKAERIGRAVTKLQALGLVAEVLLPVADQPADQLDPVIVARFLHQEALDPVTVISLDPEEDFGISPPDRSEPAPIPVLEERLPAPPVVPDSADVTDEEVEALGAAVRQRQAEHLARQAAVVVPQPAFVAMAPVAARAEDRSLWLRWEYWLIAVGIALMVAGVLLR